MLTALGLGAVLALIAANGYFVAAEFSFVAAKRGRLEDAAAAGDRRSRHAVQVHKRLNFMLSGAQLGITVTSLIVGFIAEPTLGRALEPVVGALGVSERARFGVALTAGFALATAVQMIFGELAPKNLAIAKPEPIARALAGSTLLFMRLASPIIRLFDGSANRLLRALGIEPIQELHSGGVSAEELDIIVEESAGHGKLSSRQAALLERAIDFGTLHASAAMVPWNRVTTISARHSCEDLRQLMSRVHSRFPVIGEGGAVVGLVHAKDLFDVEDDALAEVAVGTLARPALVVPETANLRSLLAALRREATEMAVVADEYGAPAGVVTLEDLVEELVGDITDEYDPAEPHVVDHGDSSWTVPGSWRIDEIERMTGVALPADSAYETVAGLVLSRMQRIPSPGDHVEVGAWRLEVLAMDGWAITAVRAQPRHGTSTTDGERTVGGETTTDGETTTGAGGDG